MFLAYPFVYTAPDHLVRACHFQKDTRPTIQSIDLKKKQLAKTLPFQKEIM